MFNKSLRGHRAAVAGLMAALLLVSLLLPAAALATSGGDLYVGQAKTVRITYADEVVNLYFTPGSSGTYTFYSTGSYDTIGGVATGYSNEYMALDDDSGSNYNFSISVYLSAGTLYRLDTALYGQGTGSYTVYVSGSSTGGTGTRSTGSSSVRVGESIYFGHTEQDNQTGNGSESIEWVVLAVEGDRALVMARKGLLVAKFTDHSSGQTWANCTLRSTLNDRWIYSAFSSSERNAILSTNVTDSRSDWDPSNLPNASRNTRSTTDKIFVLSYGEITRYLPSASSRVCYSTAYVAAHGGNADSTRQACWYWLRNPAYNNNVGSVDRDGSIATCYMNHVYGVVRPACWVSLSALGY